MRKGYIFSKLLYQCKEGYAFVVRDLDAKKSVSMRGNIPLIPNGVFFYMDIDENDNILYYDIPFSEKNRVKFANKGINLNEYKSQIRDHRKTGLLWRELKYLDNPYKTFDFNRADIVFKRKGFDIDNPVRINAIREEIRKRFRLNRQWKISVLDYLNMFTEVEKDGAYETLGLETALVNSSDYRLSDEFILIDREIEDAYKFVFDNLYQRNKVKHTVMTAESISSYVDEIGEDTTESQKDAVRQLASSKVSVITGGPGTGKTSTINLIVDCFKKNFGASSICLVAPTGKAARRMSGVAHFKASTIHSALRKVPDDEFIYYTEKNPLPYQLVIVDESSMIDILLMRDLLKAIPLGFKVYFVGDCNQLLPVDIGEPFLEFLDNENVDVVRLTKNFRQVSEEGQDIVKCAEDILNNNLDIKSNKGIVVNHIDRNDIVNHIDEDTLMLSPYNEINDEINEFVTSKYLKKGRFYINEKVIFSKNTKNYSNGDTGVVVGYDKDEVRVNLYGKEIHIPRKEWDNINPAYALTVHKSQGSEYDRIILFLPEKRTDFIDWRLLYTAVTRAKEHIDVYYYSESNENTKSEKECA